MYLDTDVLLALLKAEDWLQAAAEAAEFDDPKTSIVTALEIQLVMFEAWSRPDLAGLPEAIERAGIQLLPCTREELTAGAELLTVYPELNVFDAAHLGHARTLGEPIISTDTLYPTIEEIDHIDLRDL